MLHRIDFAAQNSEMRLPYDLTPSGMAFQEGPPRGSQELPEIGTRPQPASNQQSFPRIPMHGENLA